MLNVAQLRELIESPRYQYRKGHCLLFGRIWSQHSNGYIAFIAEANDGSLMPIPLTLHPDFITPA